MAFFVVGAVISYFLAKHRGRDPLKFVFLGAFFWMLVIPYLLFAKTKTKGLGGLDLFNALKRLGGVGENIAKAILNEFPDERSLRKSTTEKLEQVPGVGAETARAIKDVYR